MAKKTTKGTNPQERTLSDLKALQKAVKSLEERVSVIETSVKFYQAAPAGTPLFGSSVV